jgi:hypothetical protein
MSPCECLKRRQAAVCGNHCGQCDAYLANTCCGCGYQLGLTHQPVAIFHPDQREGPSRSAGATAPVPHLSRRTVSEGEDGVRGTGRTAGSGPSRSTIPTNGRDHPEAKRSSSRDWESRESGPQGVGRECAVFQCCVGERGLEHCGLCPDFPCQLFLSHAAPLDVARRYQALLRRTEIGTAAWLDEQASRDHPKEP